MSAMQKLAEQVLASYNASDRHIPDSDLDNEQPITLHVRTTLGDIRSARSLLAMIARGAEASKADAAAREAYDASL